MKNKPLILAILLLLAVGGYCSYYRFATAGTDSMLCKADGEMEWLRQEFKLTDPQFDRIRELHESYHPKCERMCGKIASSRARLDHLIDANHSVTAEVESAFKEYATLEEECRQEMLGHIYEVGAAMSPENGTRYLRMMKDHILLPYNTSHTTLQGDHSH
jgi:Spy/CpxP family protein refolding chaperone